MNESSREITFKTREELDKYLSLAQDDFYKRIKSSSAEAYLDIELEARISALESWVSVLGASLRYLADKYDSEA